MTSPRMLAVTAVAILLAAALAGSSADARRPNSSRNDLRHYKNLAAQYENSYLELTRTLDRVEQLNSRSQDHRTRRRIERTINRGRTRAQRQLPTTVMPMEPGAPSGQGYYETRPQISYDQPQPMDPQRFGALLRSLDKIGFTDSQVQMVATAAQTNWFTVDQVIAVMKVVNFDEAQVDVATTMYPRVVDYADWYRVYEAMPFESSRKKLQQRVGGIRR